MTFCLEIGWWQHLIYPRILDTKDLVPHPTCVYLGIVWWKLSPLTPG